MDAAWKRQWKGIPAHIQTWPRRKEPSQLSHAPRQTQQPRRYSFEPQRPHQQDFEKTSRPQPVTLVALHQQRQSTRLHCSCAHHVSSSPDNHGASFSLNCTCLSFSRSLFVILHATCSMLHACLSEVKLIAIVTCVRFYRMQYRLSTFALITRQSTVHYPLVTLAPPAPT